MFATLAHYRLLDNAVFSRVFVLRCWHSLMFALKTVTATSANSCCFLLVYFVVLAACCLGPVGLTHFPSLRLLSAWLRYFPASLRCRPLIRSLTVPSGVTSCAHESYSACCFVEFSVFQYDYVCVLHDQLAHTVDWVDDRLIFIRQFNRIGLFCCSVRAGSVCIPIDLHWFAVFLAKLLRWQVASFRSARAISDNDLLSASGFPRTLISST